MTQAASILLKKFVCREAFLSRRLPPESKSVGVPTSRWSKPKVAQTAAALFTTNRVVAAPVEVGRASLRSSGGRVRAVIVNSGNANCATGRAGILACERVCREAGKLFGVPAAEIFPSSTGIIGVRFPAEKIHSRLPELLAARSSDERGVQAFANAIMTTDTRAKIASVRFRTGAKEVTVLGIAKGAGMIHPQMATMLVYLFTDVGACAEELHAKLREACDDSLNCISIDGDTSTNDTALLLASGASGVTLETAGVRKKFSCGISRGMPIACRADRYRRRGRSTRDPSVCRTSQEQGRGAAGGEDDRSLGSREDGVGRCRSELGTNSGGSRKMRRADRSVACTDIHWPSESVPQRSRHHVR